MIMHMCGMTSAGGIGLGQTACLSAVTRYLYSVAMTAASFNTVSKAYLVSLAGTRADMHREVEAGQMAALPSGELACHRPSDLAEFSVSQTGQLLSLCLDSEVWC